MSRLDKQRQLELEPKRITSTIEKLKELGFDPVQVSYQQVNFTFKGSDVHFFPYSGWHSGKTIKDGRGFNRLIKQVT